MVPVVKSVSKWLASAVACTGLVLAGCSSDSGDTALKVGVIAGPEADLMRTAADQAKQTYNLDVELVEFQDYVAPNIALSDGSIDINAFQHKPYLDRMVNDRSFKLEIVGNTFVYPIGAYSRTLTSLEDLPNGSKVAIPNDPSNEGRTLLLMHKAGLVTLKDPSDLEATPVDIIDNPHDLSFIELDAAQLPRSLDDVDLAFINSTYSVASGLLPTRDSLLMEDKDSPYVNIIVSRQDNSQDPRIAQLVASFQSEAVEQKAEELFKGGAVQGWR